MSLVDEFRANLENKNDVKLETAIIIIKICREYLNHHYKNSVYGTFQKNILDIIDEFLKEVERK